MARLNEWKLVNWKGESESKPVDPKSIDKHFRNIFQWDKLINHSKKFNNRETISNYSVNIPIMDQIELDELSLALLYASRGTRLNGIPPYVTLAFPPAICDIIFNLIQKVFSLKNGRIYF